MFLYIFLQINRHFNSSNYDFYFYFLFFFFLLFAVIVAHARRAVGLGDSSVQGRCR